MQVKIGADPELFLIRNGRHESAYGLIPGTKAEPHAVPNGAVQVDGMALEFNIDPADTEDEFIHNISSVMTSLRKMVPEEYEFDIVPSVKFVKEVINEQPTDALVLGCDPDYSAYFLEQNMMPDIPITAPLRAAGGHIHIGWTEDADPFDEEHFRSCAQLVRQLDYYIGIPMVVMDRDKERMKLYGRPGAFRPKPYGVEYRTPSNFWIKSEFLQRMVYKLAKRAVDDLIAGKDQSRINPGYAEELILGHGAERARSWLSGRLNDVYQHMPAEFRAKQKRNVA